MRLSRLPALGLLGCLLLACGGDDDSPDTTPATGGQSGGAGAAGAASGSSGHAGVSGKPGAAGTAGAGGTGSSGTSGHGGALAGSGGTTGGTAGSTAGTTSAGGASAGGTSAGGANVGGANVGGATSGAAGDSATGGTDAGGAGTGGAGGTTAGAGGETSGTAGVSAGGAAGGPGGSAGTGGTSAGGTSAGGTSAGGAAGGAGAPSEPIVLLPKTSLTADEVGLLVNDNDPQSVAVAAHYQKVRKIPEAHVYHVTFGGSNKAALGGTMTSADFEAKIRQPLAAKVDASIQAYAVSFSGPNKVDCMSFTSALALGFDKKYCAPDGSMCGPGPGKPTAPSAYYDSNSFSPLADSGLRPSMMLAGTSTANVIALIDRGVDADDTFPTATGYFIRTTDGARSNPRYVDFLATKSKWAPPNGPLTMTYIDNSDGKGSNVITGKTNVLFYETGLTTVPDIATNTYRPGAVADHLTSSGGGFGTSGQMSLLRWIEAGATASYGTVVEPCAYQQKFPQSSVLVKHYFRGETLVESYWKSVRWPGEGVFVGEPLARPWGTRTSWQSGTLTIVTTTLVPNKTYAIESAPTASGPWTTVQDAIKITSEQTVTLKVTGATAAYYRLVAK